MDGVWTFELDGFLHDQEERGQATIALRVSTTTSESITRCPFVDGSTILLCVKRPINASICFYGRRDIEVPESPEIPHYLA